jgi:hypothetical protein
MKRYRLKPGKTVSVPIAARVLTDSSGQDATIQLKINAMSRFDWLYGEETTSGEVVLHIPYPLPYIEFNIPVPKEDVEEIQE